MEMDINRLPMLDIIEFIGLLIFLPKYIKVEAPPTIKNQFKLISNGFVILLLIMAILRYGGTYITRTFLAPISHQIPGLKESLVSIVFLAYGVVVAIGNSTSKRVADYHLLKGIRYVFMLQAFVLASFSLTAPFHILRL